MATKGNLEVINHKLLQLSIKSNYTRKQMNLIFPVSWKTAVRQKILNFRREIDRSKASGPVSRLLMIFLESQLPGRQTPTL